MVQIATRADICFKISSPILAQPNTGCALMSTLSILCRWEDETAMGEGWPSALMGLSLGNGVVDISKWSPLGYSIALLPPIAQTPQTPFSLG